MELNIFFTSKKERVEFLESKFNVEQIDMNNKESFTPEIDGLHIINMKDQYESIPGYWVELVFNKNKDGKELYNRLIKEVAVNKRNKEVFYPTNNSLPLKQLYSGWMNKYNFSIKNSSNDQWSVFFKELKSHMKYKRMDLVYYGLNLILRYNPFFLKKYRRYYLFEDLAYYYEEQGNLSKAIKCLKKQGILNPKSVEPYLNMSSFYIINGMEEDAIEVCKEGMKISPQHQYLMCNLIIALSNVGNYSYAITFLKRAIENDNNSKLLWKLLADVYYEIESNEDAIRCYKKALSIKQNKSEDISNLDSELNSSLGACYFEVEKYNDAAKYFKKALVYNKNDAYTILSLSQIYFNYLSNNELAFKYSKILVHLVPDNGFGHYQLGLIYFNKGNIEKSKWHLYKARRLMPNYEPVHDAIEMLKKSLHLAK